ncbi:putative deacetylase LmbE-like domain-containing protein [Kockiozyma suomiensis]|uniref:putative deacetylase LmbE-like domain-containing protein n=1 Tax=Kockiozyma suomiensis TaxID=1337062 RepID=UPI0033437CEF
MIYRSSTKMRARTFIIFLILAIALWVLTRKVFRPTNARVLSSHFAHKRIALIIAHPDDEAMFFGPTLNALHKLASEINGGDSALPDINLRILCLSTGNADNLGETRQAELRASAAKFGIPPTNVVIFDDPRVQDQMGLTWPSDAIAELAAPYLSDVDVVLTFDSKGVSGHGNHASLNKYAQEYLVNGEPDNQREVWTLSTVNVVRKYASFLDILVTYSYNQFFSDTTRSLVLVSDVHEYAVTRQAMTDAHKSQMRWFRWGWISLSRYMVVNDLKMLIKRD